MTPESCQKLRGLLLQHESFRAYPYNDTNGFVTIGIGRCLTTRGISKNEAFFMLDEDIFYFSSKLSQLCDYFDVLDEARKVALVDMCFNLGINGFMEFHDMHMAFREREYEKAAKAMLASKWAVQVGERAVTLAKIIECGEI